jgi:transcriptional regulator with PAS, ATPase and Fis domain
MQEEQSATVPSDARLTPFQLGGLALLVLVLLIGTFGYAIHEHNLASQLSGQNAQMLSALNDTRNQMVAIVSRMNAPAPSPDPGKAVSSGARQNAPGTRQTAARRRSGEDARWRQVNSKLAEHENSIQSTRKELADARTELQGGIARTHDEVVVLQKKGERSYYEFDLNKSKRFQRTGLIGISLRKSNEKHQYADLALLVEDRELSKKHVNIYEPVLFYPVETRQPVELVINSIEKNHIHGYISQPKYSQAELAALSANNPAAGAPNVKPQDEPSLSSSDGLKPRRRLEIPR